MSLISDTDYLIHSLRVQYLKHIDDPYGARIISLDQNYHSNPYIDASGLADIERWPELGMPSSPTPSDDESAPAVRRRHSGFPGANLKYTTTILGPTRTGAMGLRVNGKRQSMPRNPGRLSLSRENAGGKSSNEETLITTEVIAATPTSPMKPRSPRSPIKDSVVQPQKQDAQDGSAPPVPAKGPVLMFIPKFRGAEEMAARRRQRMAARANGPGMVRAPMVAMPINPEFSSSSSSEPEAESEDEVAADEDEEEFDMVADADDAVEVDEFDPEFAASRAAVNSDSASETGSILSGASVGSSVLNSSVPPSTSARASRLSPVREGGERPSVSPEHDDGKLDAMFEMVTPAPSTAANSRTQTPAPAPSATANTPAGMFERRPVPPARAGVSALTAMLASTSSSSSSNPFTELYSAISGRPETDSMIVRVFFPMARKPKDQALELSVKKDATVEEVLGYALWTYWEESWLPQIDEGLSGEEDPKWDIRCSASGWILRIAEEDGEVDEDWPPPERMRKISNFNFEAYAVVEATPSQIQQNKILEAKIQRRISRVVVKKKSTGLLTQAAPSTNLVPPADLLGISSSAFGSMGSSVGLSSSLGPSSSSGPPLFLRIRIAGSADEPGHVSTTIQASGGMYMQEVLELVCQNQKRGFTDPKEYALVIETKEAKVNIPLDRTVRSLQGRRDLILMKKNLLHEYGVEMRERKATNDPNASIFTTDVSIQEQTLSSMLDLMQAYRKYTVYRKLPMMVTRSARVLTIDGGYIHVRIIPGATKAKHVFDSGKTSSYHLKSVVACQQSSKNAATFKLVVHSGAERNKRYEFEAENPKIANEIVSTIRALKAAMEKPGGGKASRRNTRIGPSSRPPGV
ncbi:stress-activated map kinase interacting protein 1-domain-containing protein [Epithele typhae]|uniref:stress-activated map kinase interacting protein 1-domain-containing protein n=1 Tax=Epithele typhae TaxID=378194 RepID=UPI002008A456|nr:stress-activated map kinase interacting protein 1-domain-containing protein [Epithele typhae]KAH9941294.1 stress-activated map kinase interacting protein 1-domain-containing protein [Epithele typhae]